jgi:hypothetical protein
MNPITNPYTPGVGSPPLELAGRNDLRENVRICLERLRIGNAARIIIIMVGLRGVRATYCFLKWNWPSATSFGTTNTCLVPN